MSRIKTAAGALTGLGILCAAFVGGWEGRKLVAYKDLIGIPTICYGETRGVKMGDTATEEECRAMLGDGLADFERDIRRCLNDPDKLEDGQYIAFVSLAYNIGAGAFCKSSVVRYANAGDKAKSCEAIKLYNRAGGKVVHGLVRRRAHEYRVCTEGVSALR